jgi:hypothetical protein
VAGVRQAAAPVTGALPAPVQTVADAAQQAAAAVDGVLQRKP